MCLAQEIHRVTAAFPKHELHSLTYQMRRAAVSIPSNIAEGSARGGTREFIHFLYVARGSLSELDTQLRLAVQFGYVGDSLATAEYISEVGRLLNAIIRGLRQRSHTSL